MLFIYVVDVYLLIVPPVHALEVIFIALVHRIMSTATLSLSCCKMDLSRLVYP